MKKQFLFLILFCATTLLSAQNIWTVNNQPGANADYTNIQDANNAATAGDIIMVQGSPFDYADVTITKRLVIIGPGYFLGQNENPYTQANPVRAYVRDFYIDGAGASGSLVTGMTTKSLSLQNPGVGITDVIIQRCKIENLNISYPVSSTVKECFLGGDGSDIPISFSFYNTTTSTFENNVIVNTSGNAFFVNYAKSSTFNHNTFIGLNLSSYSIGNIEGATFNNNLFLTDQDVTFSNTPTVVLNNMSNTNLWNNYSSNITNVNADDVIIGWADATGLSPDVRYSLKASSPAINAANDGTNIGAFQEAGGYVLSGIPFVPNIYSLTAPDFGTNGSGITINIKAKANN